MTQGGVGVGGGGGSAGTNQNRQPATAAAMAQRGGGGGGGGGGVDHYLAAINRYYRQPAAPPAMAHGGVSAGVGVGAAGMDHNRRLQSLASYYGVFNLVPSPSLPALAAAVADNAGSSSDIEDPPLDVPAASNPPRVAAALPPPLTDDTPGVDLGQWWFDVAARDARRRRRAEPSEDDDEEGSRHRRKKQADQDEASSVVGAASPEEVYEALKEIPDLGRADLLRAYSKLIRDARQFRCLMALPNDMRKDWLLMEIGRQ